MLHRHLLILQWFTASLFDALIAANAVNVVERLHTNYPAFVHWDGSCRNENVVKTSRLWASVVRGGLFRLGLTSGDLDSKSWYEFLTDHQCISLSEDSPPKVDYGLVH